MKKDEVTLTAVCHTNASDAYRDGFVAVYQEAFGGPPYFEHYEPEDVVRDVWIPHFNHGIIIVAHVNGKVIGFGCAEPVSYMNEEDRNFLLQKYVSGALPVDPGTMWYMSELGVGKVYRKHGLGLKLIEERLRLISDRGGSWYIMRTAAEGSNSKHLYESIGAMEIPGTQKLSVERIYLYGSCESTKRYRT